MSGTKFPHISNTLFPEKSKENPVEIEFPDEVGEEGGDDEGIIYII
jgi:hypothetical protein